MSKTMSVAKELPASQGRSAAGVRRQGAEEVRWQVAEGVRRQGWKNAQRGLRPKGEMSEVVFILFLTGSY